jgi:integrase
MSLAVCTFRRMASIRTKTLSTGATAYLARWRDPTGREVTRQFGRKRDAKDFLRKLEHELAIGDYIDPSGAKITLSEWWARWWPNAKGPLRASTCDRDERAFWKHIAPRFGMVPLGRIEHVAIADWVNQLTADNGLAPDTVAKYFNVLHKLLRGAVVARLLRYNPADGVKLPKVERADMLFINPVQIADLAASIDPRYSALVMFLSWTGFRIGEAAGLQWGHVDLLRRHVDIVQTVVEVSGRHIINPPKTRAARRRVPLTTGVCAALATCTAPNPAEDAWVFPAPAGGPLRVNAWRRRMWKPAVGLLGKDELRIHDLRHTAVSLWIAAGASPKEIATWAGHTSVSVVLDRYGHLFEASAERVTSALDQMAV